jgi:hypothetical protein
VLAIAAASNPAAVAVIASTAEVAITFVVTVIDRTFKKRRLPGTEEGIIRSGTWTKLWARSPSIASSYYY